MESINTHDCNGGQLGPSVVTLGNFDGVHLGHRELFRHLVRVSRDYSCRSIVYTFSPHPLKYLAPDKAPLLLNTPLEKQRLIAASHIDLLVEAPFDAKLANMSPEQFVDEILIAKLQVRALVVGYDYAFGRGRRGDVAFLQAAGKEKGFQVDVLQPVGADGKPYSSTRIRQLLFSGQVAEVVTLLGRNYNLEGCVVPGEQRGRELGFPTANLETEKEQLPARGVYAVKVRYAQQEFNGVVNIGCRPTFGAGETTIEVHLIDFTGRLYAESLRIYFVERLRGEMTFSGPKQLAEAIEQDVLRARQILESSQVVQFREYLS